MKVRLGKGDWLELEHIPLESHVEDGARFFSATATRALAPRDLALRTHAATVANTAVSQTFDKWVSDIASTKERAAIAPERVQAAVFRDRSGSMRVVYREVVVRFEPQMPQAKRKALLGKFGLKVRNRNQFVGDQIIAVDPKRKYVAERVVELANELTESDEVAFAFPNFVPSSNGRRPRRSSIPRSGICRSSRRARLGRKRRAKVSWSLCWTMALTSSTQI
jgi:hypothetical protein